MRRGAELAIAGEHFSDKIADDSLSLSLTLSVFLDHSIRIPIELVFLFQFCFCRNCIRFSSRN